MALIFLLFILCVDILFINIALEAKDNVLDVDFKWEISYKENKDINKVRMIKQNCFKFCIKENKVDFKLLVNF